MRVSGVFRFKVGEPQGTLGCFGFRGLGFRVSGLYLGFRVYRVEGL